MINNKKAFTLAEVLVTLAIIGVVAALTIPSVIVKQQKTQYYTQFMKTYNTLTQAFNYASIENGSYDSWGVGNSAEGIAALEQIISPYLKISQKCTSAQPCNFNNVKYSTLNNDAKSNYSGLFSNVRALNLILNDGAALHFNVIAKVLYITFDTNGTKGPNIVGRDIFRMNYIKHDNKYMLWNDTLDAIDADTNETLSPSAMLEYLEDTCSTDGTEPYDCSARLLLERKMNY